MVTMNLLSIDKEHNIAYYHCLPEGKEYNSFNLGLNPVDKEIVSNSLGKRNSYVVHAAQKIYEFYSEKGSVPKEASSVWC